MKQAIREIFSVFTDGRQLALAALTALVYAALLIPLKPFPLIPGITEIRIANFVPVVFAIFFGPAAAWGAAFGNLIGDLFGTLSEASIFGFVGNFMFAYVTYKIWHHYTKGEKITLTQRQLGVFWLAAFLASGVCALIIAPAASKLGYVPSTELFVLFAFITLNNFLPSLVFGPILIKLFYARLKKAGLIYGR